MMSGRELFRNLRRTIDGWSSVPPGALAFHRVRRGLLEDLEAAQASLTPWGRRSAAQEVATRMAQLAPVAIKLRSLFERRELALEKLESGAPQMSEEARGAALDEWLRLGESVRSSADLEAEELRLSELERRLPVDAAPPRHRGIAPIAAPRAPSSRPEARVETDAASRGAPTANEPLESPETQHPQAPLPSPPQPPAAAEPERRIEEARRQLDTLHQIYDRSLAWARLDRSRGAEVQALGTRIEEVASAVEIGRGPSSSIAELVQDAEALVQGFVRLAGDRRKQRRERLRARWEIFSELKAAPGLQPEIEALFADPVDTPNAHAQWMKQCERLDGRLRDLLHNAADRLATRFSEGIREVQTARSAIDDGVMSLASAERLNKADGELRRLAEVREVEAQFAAFEEVRALAEDVAGLAADIERERHDHSRRRDALMARRRRLQQDLGSLPEFVVDDRLFQQFDAAFERSAGLRELESVADLYGRLGADLDRQWALFDEACAVEIRNLGEKLRRLRTVLDIALSLDMLPGVPPSTVDRDRVDGPEGAARRLSLARAELTRLEVSLGAVR
ncbi:MAG: hypothetical protein AAFY88_07875, partial [Acidobacteriota bacterium]